VDLMPFARNARGVQGLRASRRARLDCPARDNRMPMQVPAGAEGASAAEGRAASGRCGRRPQHRCERADARDMERAAREHRMRSRCAAGAEGARAAEGRVAPPPPPSTSLRRNFWVLRVGFSARCSPSITGTSEANRERASDESRARTRPRVLTASTQTNLKASTTTQHHVHAHPAVGITSTEPGRKASPCKPGGRARPREI